MIPCPPELELARAVSDGADPALAAHLAGCARCHATWASTARVVELARQLPVAPLPSHDRREELRTAILAAQGLAASRRPAPRVGRGARVVAVVLAAAAVTLVAWQPWSRRSPTHRHHGTVTAHAGARYLINAGSPDEIVTLHDGTIAVEVTPLASGERFRVVTADAEVEVRGTAFTVSATLGHMTAVAVDHGVVEVRPHDGARVVLHGGERWDPPVIDRAAAAPIAVDPVAPVAPIAVAPVATTAPPRHATARDRVASAPAMPAMPAARDTAAPIVAPPPSEPTPPARRPQDDAYDQAWAALRTGGFARAAAGFADVAILDADGPLAEDASYWYAVALARAGQRGAAAAFRAFLGQHPRSARAGAASAALGWILVEAGQPTAAERAFQAAADDADPAVRASAAAGLRALVPATP